MVTWTSNSKQTREHKRIWNVVKGVKIMKEKIKISKNDFHLLILPLYTDARSRRSMDYAKMLINQPDVTKSNILVHFQ